MSSTEATLWLRALLCKSESRQCDVEDIASHGLKATLLSWINTHTHGGWSERDQKLMDHHVDREARSVLIYSRCSGKHEVARWTTSWADLDNIDPSTSCAPPEDLQCKSVVV